MLLLSRLIWYGMFACTVCPADSCPVAVMMGAAPAYGLIDITLCASEIAAWLMTSFCGTVLFCGNGTAPPCWLTLPAGLLLLLCGIEFEIEWPNEWLKAAECWCVLLFIWEELGGGAVEGLWLFWWDWEKCFLQWDDKFCWAWTSRECCWASCWSFGGVAPAEPGSMKSMILIFFNKLWQNDWNLNDLDGFWQNTLNLHR